jgi:hypothetical protein
MKRVKASALVRGDIVLRPLRKVGPHQAPTGVAQTLKSGVAPDGFWRTQFSCQAVPGRG